MYGGLTWKVILPTAYIVANYLKRVTGTAGGVTAQLLLPRKTWAPAGFHSNTRSPNATSFARME